jgi:hypothetical protein
MHHFSLLPCVCIGGESRQLGYVPLDSLGELELDPESSAAHS